MMEATVTMALVLNKYKFSFHTDPSDVGMKTGTTIHTFNGLNMIVKKTEVGIPASEGWWEIQHLSHGLSPTGKPLTLEEEERQVEGGCPFHH